MMFRQIFLSNTLYTSYYWTALPVKELGLNKFNKFVHPPSHGAGGCLAQE